MSCDVLCNCARCLRDWRDWITLTDDDPPNECEPIDAEDVPDAA